MDLEQTAIERLKMASDMSLRLYKQPLVITYSGGKDSDVLLHLAGKAGIQYEVLHSLTTADAPETVWHVRDTFRRLEMAGVKCTIDTHRTPDGGNVTMWNLIPRKLMPPTRWMRYCCSELKEGGAKGRWIATGVRWAESAKRKTRGALEVLHSNKSKRLTLMNDNDASRMLMENCQLKPRTRRCGRRCRSGSVWRDGSRSRGNASLLRTAYLSARRTAQARIHGEDMTE